MSIVQLHSELTSIPNPRKLSQCDKQSHLKNERDKLSDMIDLFYDKAKSRIDKALSKDNKRAILICKELLNELTMYPKQQIYEISRLSDELFNEMARLNNTISQFLKAIESLKEKIAKELAIQKEKVSLKQQKQAIGDYHIALLRKINFKKQKTCLTHKLKHIDILNKKLVKFEADPDEAEDGCSIQIDGKRIQALVLRYKKISFESKKREYLLCLSCRKGTHQGQLTLYSDKLQKIASFNHLPPIELRTFLDIVQLEQYLFLVHINQIIRISLTNQNQDKSILIREKINKAAAIGGELVLWVEDRDSNQAVLGLNSELNIIYQQYLRTTIKSIGLLFKIAKTEQKEQIYFIGKNSNGTNDLFKLQGTRIDLINKDIGIFDEVVECKVQGRVECVLLRKGGEFMKFSPSAGLKERMIQIDMENGQSMQKCCILGQYFYALHQSGKQLLECHFKLPFDQNNPQP